MNYNPPNESAKIFLERIKREETKLVGCQKCACRNCVNYDKCRWGMCKDCGSGEYSLPCKEFKEL